MTFEFRMFSPIRKAMRNTVPMASHDVGTTVLSGRRGIPRPLARKNSRSIR